MTLTAACLRRAVRQRWSCARSKAMRRRTPGRHLDVTLRSRSKPHARSSAQRFMCEVDCPFRHGRQHLPGHFGRRVASTSSWKVSKQYILRASTGRTRSPVHTRYRCRSPLRCPCPVNLHDDRLPTALRFVKRSRKIGISAALPLYAPPGAGAPLGNLNSTSALQGDS